MLGQSSNSRQHYPVPWDQLGLFETKMTPFENLGQVLATMFNRGDQFELIRTNLDQLGPIETNQDPLRPVGNLSFGPNSPAHIVVPEKGASAAGLNGYLVQELGLKRGFFIVTMQSKLPLATRCDIQDRKVAGFVLKHFS